MFARKRAAEREISRAEVVGPEDASPSVVRNVDDCVGLVNETSPFVYHAAIDAESPAVLNDGLAELVHVLSLEGGNRQEVSHESILSSFPEPSATEHYICVRAIVKKMYGTATMHLGRGRGGFGDLPAFALSLLRPW